MQQPVTPEPVTPAPVEAVVKPLADGAKVGTGVVKHHGVRLAIVFACIALPLWAFGQIALEVIEGQPLAIDTAILQALHAHASAGLDQLFLLLSAVGYSGGVVPFDVVLVIVLALRRHFHQSTFVALAVVGSALINVAAKHAFHRIRPGLWLSIAPETTFSFPSGHAMGSATLACALVILSWNTRARWPVLIAAVLFTLGVGMSRVYLGVHFPSDIAAGWVAAIAWVVGVYQVAFRGRLSWEKPVSTEKVVSDAG